MSIVVNPGAKGTSVVVKDATAAFVVLAGEGMKSKFNNSRQYHMCIEVTAEQKDEIQAEIDKVWTENKSPKIKKPQYDNDRIFEESKNVDGGYTLWVSEDVTNKVIRKVKKGTGYKMQNFLDMGAGSKLDGEFKFFHYSRDGLEAIGFRLVGATLNQFVAYSGSSDLDGEELADDDITVDSGVDENLEANVSEFKDLLEDGDFDDAEDVLDELTAHPKYKEFRKELRAARKA